MSRSRELMANVAAWLDGITYGLLALVMAMVVVGEREAERSRSAGGQAISRF